MKKCLFILLMLVFTTFAGFAQTMRGYEYWFDNDYAGRTTTISSQQQLSLSLDIESINPGLHYLNFRAQGSDGKWGCLSRYIVYVNNHANHLSRVDYWLDSKIDGKKSQGVNGNSVLISVDISQMERGKHTLAFQGFTERGSFAMLDSLEFDAIDAPIAPMPVISYEGNVISISIADPTATTLPVFYYTLDGTDPDTTSTKYEGPFEVTHNCVVKSVSYLEGAKNSPVDSLVVNWFKCEKPVVTWNGEQLSISTETEGADIYYSVKEYESSPTGSGTEADPYNVAAAIAKCKEVGETASAETYYVKGIVSQVTNQYDTTYGNASFYISDNGSHENDFMASRTNYIGNQKYADGQRQIQVGDDVVVCGRLVNYRGNTPETNTGGYLVSMEEPELSTKYENPISVPNNAVVRAKATKQNMTDSDLAITSTGVEPYAVLNENNTVLTFFYDGKKNSRSGMDVESFINAEDRPWHAQRENITKVIFDSSFANCTSITSTLYWFQGCSSLNNVTGIENLKTDNVTNMTAMFYNCSSLAEIDLSKFNTANTINVTSLFAGCLALTNVKVTGINTANMKYMNSMFQDCSNLTSLDLSSFNTVNATGMSYMFSGCSALTTIYVGEEWSTTSVTESADMFAGCTSLEGGAGTTFDASHVDAAYARIDGGPNSQTPGYFTAKSTASNLEIFSVDKTVTYVPNQSITPTPSITMTPGNDAEWLTDLAIGLTNTTTGESDDPLQFTASIYYPNSTETFSYLDAMRGTLNPRDGDLTTNAETGAIDNTGTQYIPGYNNVPRSGGFIAYEALQDGSLIIPIRVTSNKSLFVVEDDGHVKTDIQFKDADGNTLTLLPSPLCAVSSEYVMGFLSFNVEQGRKYYVFCNGSKPRFAGYVFSTERITIDSETMKDVLDLLLPLTPQDVEVFAVDATTELMPNEPLQATRSVTMTPGNDSAWGVRLLEDNKHALKFTASSYYPGSTSSYTFWGGARGTNPAKDGDLTEGGNSGDAYDYTIKNTPKSGAYVTFEVSQSGSLIIPMHVPTNKPLYVIDSNGKVKTDIQFVDTLGQVVPMLAEPLCVFSETASTPGYLSFNVTPGGKYTIFITGGVDLRYGGYVFSTESITIDPVTMANVKSILDAEPYAVLSENNTVLTFYYDNQKETRGGFSIKDQGGSNTPTPSVDTNGTEAKPYTVEDAITVGSGTNVFVKAYIVGWIDGSTFGEGAKFNADATVASNIIIAATPDETDISKCMPVQLPSGAVRSAVNLQDNAGNYKKEILIVGNIEKYFGTTGVKSVSYAKIGNTEVGTKPDSGGNTPTPSGDNGTATAPLTVAQAIALIDAESNISEAYVKGKISQIDSYNATYKSITYWISDDGATITQLQVYSGKGLNGADFNSKEDLTVGQTVVIKGALKMYSSVYEFDKNSSIISIDGAGSRQSGARRNRSSIITDYAETITKVVFDESFANYYPTSTASWFQGCTSLAVTSGIENLKTDNVTNMNSMFATCTSLTSLDLRYFKTNNVRNMRSMFSGCSSLTTIYVGSRWSTTNVTESAEMFSGCTNLVGGAGTTYDETHADHTYAHIDGGVDNPGYLTELIRKTLTADDYFEWNGMGAGATKKSETPSRLCNYYIGQSAEVPYGDPNVSAYAYADLSAYDRLEITATAGTPRILLNRDAEDGYWNADESQSHQIESTQSGWSSKYFSHSGNVWTVDLKQMVADKGFAHLNAIKGDNWSAVTITKMELVKGLVENTSAEPYAVLSENNTVLTFFYDEKKAANNGMSVGPFSHYTDREWDNVASKITNVIFDSSFANATTLTSTAYWFWNCNKLESIEGIQNLNTANITTMQCMFTNCSSLSSLDVRNFNTDKVTNMGQMFSGCSALTNLDLSNFNTSLVYNFWSMFFECSGLKNLDLRNFNTSNLEYINMMFYGCSGLTSLDISNFNTEKVTGMFGMFNGCSNLVNLDMSNFKTNNVQDMHDLFAGCSSLASIQAGNAAIPDSIYAQIGNPNLLMYVNEASLAPASVTNVVVDGAAENIVLTDVEQGNNNFYCPQEFTARRISYTHNYRQATQVGVSRGWETIVLPFTVQTITHEKNGLLAPFGVDGGKPFWLRQLTENGLVSAQQIEANMPYLISMPNNGRYPADYNQAGNVTFSATNVVVPMTEQREMSGNNRMLIPTTMRVAQSPSVYAINRNAPYENNPEGSIFVADYREVRPFEAYVEHTNGARFISLDDLSEGAVTNIQAIHDIASADVVKVYNLSGVLLKTGKRQEVMSQLPKGIYIVNGVKVVVK